MGIRRRRKKLTSLLSSLDRDVRSATLRQVKRQAAPPAADAVEEEETTTTTPPPVGTEITETAPDQWAKIIGGYYYPPTKTGGLGQVELFLDQDISLSVSDKMYVSGTEVKWNQNASGKNYTGSFKPNTSDYDSTTTIRVVSQYGSSAWSTRAASTKPVYASIPPGVTNSILYTVTNKDYIPARVTLAFRGQVESYYASTTTATITFTAAHAFIEGSILDVSSLGSPMQGIDGIIKVSAVPSSTQISYEFATALSAEIPSTTPSTASYVYAVVSKYTTIGSSWISSTTNKVYIWDGLRWVGYTEALEEGLVTNDGIAPAPPTSLSISSEGYAEAAVLGKISKSSVTLGWTAPTTNASGATLNDLAGYRIWYSTASATGPWTGKANFGQETTQTIIGLTPELTYYFRVIAFDAYGLDSTGLDGSVLTDKKALSVEVPSAPILTSRLGTIKVAWDGKDNTGADMIIDQLAYIEVHYSTTMGFTPGPTTLLDTIGVGGSGYVIAADLTYSTDYYFKFIAVDINKRITGASLQSTSKVLPLVDTDLIAAKLNAPLSSWPFALKAVTAGALADGAINASTVFGPDVVTQDAIAADAIGVDQLAADSVTAGKIVAGTITTTQIAALTIEAGDIKSNAITTIKLDAGAVTAEKIEVGTITGDRINATTRIRLGDSNVTTPNNYIEFGYVTLPGSGISAPGILGQYAGAKTFYMGGWRNGSQTAGFSLGVISGTSYKDILAVAGYDNGLSNATSGVLTAGTFSIVANGGSYSDSLQGDITLTANAYGAVVLSPSNQEDAQGRITGVIVNGRIRIATGGDLSVSSTAHPFQIGDSTGVNLRLDNNEIASLTNGVASPIYMNHTGGKVHVGGSTADLGSLNTGVWDNVIGTTSTRDVYINTTGQLGVASSSRRYKNTVAELDINPLSILSITPVTFKYNAEHMSTEANPDVLQVGFIAEELDEAGLGVLVGYDSEGRPDDIQYSRYIVALQAVVRYQAAQINDLAARIEALEAV